MPTRIFWSINNLLITQDTAIIKELMYTNKPQRSGLGVGKDELTEKETSEKQRKRRDFVKSGTVGHI